MTMTKTRLAAAFTAIASITLATAACGTSEGSSADDTGSNDSSDSSSIDPSTSPSEGCDSYTAPEASGPVSVTDSLGRTVELDKPATRVVTLEWQQTEDVLSLCITPVGVADVEGYSLWDTAEALPDGVTDVGTRGEASMDAVFKTDPDLVIIEAYAADDEVLTQLEEYDVPVLVTSGADAADPVAQMKETFNLIAEATGRSDRAETVLGEFDAKLAEGTTAIADAGLSTTNFVYFDGWIEGGNVALRPFGQGSLTAEIGESLGLTNVWTGEVDPQYGLGQTDIEGLTAVGDAMIFYTGTDDEESDIIPEVEKNSVWQTLPAVQSGQVYAFPAGIWTFGGPRSCEQLVDAYVSLLTS